jgi:hypothetical protein
MLNVILNEAKRSEESPYRSETVRFFAALRMTTNFSTEQISDIDADIWRFFAGG